jgi:hypothetical protein
MHQFVGARYIQQRRAQPAGNRSSIAYGDWVAPSTPKTRTGSCQQDTHAYSQVKGNPGEGPVAFGHTSQNTSNQTNTIKQPHISDPRYEHDIKVHTDRRPAPPKKPKGVNSVQKHRKRNVEKQHTLSTSKVAAKQNRNLGTNKVKLSKFKNESDEARAYNNYFGLLQSRVFSLQQ